MSGSRAALAARSAKVSHLVRLLWLIACATAGFAVGAGGVFFTGEALWWLAIPAAVALGWLSLADPSRCLAAAAPRDDRTRDR